MTRKKIFDDDKDNNSGFDDSGSGKKKSLMHRELNVSISPKKILKGFLVVALLLGVFFLGRLSVGDFDLTSSATTDIEEPVVEEPEVAQEEEAPVEEPAEEETPPQEELSEPEPEPEERIITDYSKVSVVINKANVKWMETWGKIMSLSYSIKNDEDGNIQPGSFKLSVEGYSDEFSQIRINFPESQQTIKAGETSSAEVEIPKGFSYAKQTTGNLEKVRLSVILYDILGKPIASFSDEFDLSG